MYYWHQDIEIRLPRGISGYLHLASLTLPAGRILLERHRRRTMKGLTQVSIDALHQASLPEFTCVISCCTKLVGL